MLNPKHILQLDQAINFILGPHLDSQLVTQLIKRGQQSLNQLRIQATYPSLLCYYLASLTEKSKIDSGLKVSNYLIFVLLEVKKLTPLHDETIWWHLLEFFYGCNEKVENIVIEIILQHFIQYDDTYSNCYKPFISFRYEENSNIPMYKIAKLLRIIRGLITQLQKEQSSQSEEKYKWRHTNCLFLIDSLCAVYRGLGKNFCSFSQQIIVKVLYLLLIIHKDSQQGAVKYDKFYNQDKIKSFFCLIKSDIAFLSKTTKMLLFLFCNQYSQFKDYYENFCYIDNQIFLNTLKCLLKSRTYHNSQNYEQFFILSYSLLQFQANGYILESFFKQIEQAYYNYITEVQLKKQNQIFLLQSQPDLQTSLRSSNWYKYLFLTEALCRKDRFFLQILSRNSQLNRIVLLGFCQQDILKYEEKITLLDTIITYYKSVIHHPKTFNKNIIKSSFKFLYRFVIEYPGFDLYQLCSSLLDLRARFSQLQIYCDILLSKSIEMIVTCNESYKLMDLLELWVKNLEENYMDVCVGSYYPILILMEETQELHIAGTANNKQLLQKPKIKFLSLFKAIIELIVQQTLNNKESNKLQVDTQWYDIMEIFYKWSVAFVKYTVNLLKSNTLNIEVYRKICQKSIDHQRSLIQDKVDKIVCLSISHIFKNQLYSTDTAFIYLLYLLGKMKQQGAKDLIESMMFQSFWRHLSLDEVLFHLCILIGIQIFYYQRYDFREINEICSHVVGNKIQVERQIQKRSSNIQQIEKIKNEAFQFIFLFSLQNQLKQSVNHLLQNIFSLKKIKEEQVLPFNNMGGDFRYQQNYAFYGYRD